MILSDEEFVRQFENASLPEEFFHHRDHIRLAWIYLQRASFLAAATRFASGLQHFAAAKGKATLYHETITLAYLALVHERMLRDGVGATFEEFAAQQADLMTWRPSVLERYYSPEALRSELARRAFLMPDRVERQRATGL
jgi:hypothetical protein